MSNCVCCNNFSLVSSKFENNCPINYHNLCKTCLEKNKIIFNWKSAKEFLSKLKNYTINNLLFSQK